MVPFEFFLFSVETTGIVVPKSQDIGLLLGVDRRSRWKKRVLFVVILAALGVAGWFGWSWYTAPTPPPSYVTGVVSSGSIETTVSATGTVEPVRTVQVGAEISGRVVSVETAWNESVTVGQVLVRLDTQPIETELEQAQAQLEASTATAAMAQADYDAARKTDKRAQTLTSQGLQSAAQLETTNASRARAKAQLDNARANRSLAAARVKQVQTNLEKAVIRSPIDGVVLNRFVEPGQAVAASFQTPVLFSIVEDLAHMELHLSIDEADISRVLVGMTATFTVDAYPDDIFVATVKTVRIAPQVAQNVVTYLAVLTVDNPDGKLWPGMTATANITSSKTDTVLRVPNVALRFVPPEVVAQMQAKRPPGGGAPGGMPFLGRQSGGASASEKESRLNQRQNSLGAAQSKQRTDGRVWILKDGKPEAVPVVIGVTDGSFTQIVSGALVDGDVILTGVKNKTL